MKGDRMRAMILTALLALAAQTGAQAADGKAVFGKHCAACHQISGAGIPGAFPALKGNPFVQGDADAVIATVLKGRGGMPTFAASVDDDNLARVLTYVRGAWGNQAAPVSAAAVRAVRERSRIGAVVDKEQPTNAH